MSEEYVQASPGTQKRRRRHRRRWAKARKKCRYNEDDTNLNVTNLEEDQVTEILDSINELSTIDEGKENITNVEPNSFLDVAFYDDQLSENELEDERIDLFANEKELEKVAAVCTPQPIRHLKEDPLNREFIPVSELPREGDCPAHFNEFKTETQIVPAASQSFITETQILKECEAADVLDDIKKQGIEFSQWDSPLKKVSVIEVVEVNPTSIKVPQNAVAQAIIDDFNELCCSQNGSPKLHRTQIHESPEFKFKTQVLRTYSRKRAEKCKKTKTARKLIDHYDSDSKSSLSSELSVQNDDLMDCSPAGDCVELNKSSRVCENLLNLSTFFSQSFTQEDSDSTVDGVYNYIMLMKAKRNGARLLDWYRSGNNFKVSASVGSSDFEGFPDSDIESMQSTFSYESENIQTFLDDDEEVFHEVRASFLAEDSKQPDPIKIYSDQDIERVLESADKVLAEITQHMEMKDRLNETKETLEESVPKKQLKQVEEQEVKATERQENNIIDGTSAARKTNLIFANDIQNLPSYTISKTNFVGFKSAFGKKIRISEQAKRKAHNILTEPDSCNDEDLVKELNRISENSFSKDVPLKEDDKVTDHQQSAYHHKKYRSFIKSQKSDLSFNNKEIVSTKENIIQQPRFHEEKENIYQKPLTSFEGFQSASGKTVSVSKEALFKAHKLFNEVENDKDGLNKLVENSDKADTKQDIKHDIIVKEMDKEDINKTNKRRDSKKRPLGFDGEDFKNAVPTLTGGFKSASGKEIKISTVAIEKAQSLFNNIDDLDDINEIPGECLEGFATSSDTNKIPHLLINNNSLKSKSENNMKDVEVEKCEHMNQKMQEAFKKPSIGFGGFQSASGREFSISKDALFKAQKLFSEVDNDKNGLNAFVESSEKDDKDNVSKPSKKCASSSRLSAWVADDFKGTVPAFKGGYKHVSGKGIKISAVAMEKAQSLFNNVDDLDNINEIPGECLEGFSRSTDTRKISEILIDNNVLNSCENNMKVVEVEKSEHVNQKTLEPFKKPIGFGGFQSASGREFSISKNALFKAQKLFNEVDNDKYGLSEFVENSEKDDKDNVNKPDKECASGSRFSACVADDFKGPVTAFTGEFKSASGKRIKISTVAMEKAQNLYNKADDLDDNYLESCQNSNIEISEDKNKSKSTRSVRKSVSRSEKNLVSPLKSNISIIRPSPLSLNNNNTTPLQATTKSISNLYQTEKFLTPGKVKSKDTQFNTPDLKEFFDSVHTSTPQTIKRRNNLSLTQEISASTAALLEDELKSSVTEDFRKICWDDFDDSFKENKSSPKKLKPRQMNDLKEQIHKAKKFPQYLTEQIKNARRVKRQKQLECIKSKQSAPSLIVPGSLFIRKGQPGRINWQNIVTGYEPKIFTLEELDQIGVNEDVANIHFSNAASFKFDGILFYPEIANADFIDSVDGVQLIPDDDNKFGLYEIEQAFISMHGVYPSLVTTNWIQHHYKMILLKYSWLEKSFPTVLSNQLCTPENMILQLKYRYDREIDRTERSVLKKILECDDSPAKRMVLFVVDIHQNNVEIELELTDWWYSIRTSIDLAMHSLIRSGKICIGTKLMIQNAELLNCENGCSPLEVPPQTRLKIHTNSTKRAKWNIKLGLYGIPRPFSISLDSVKENGGLITRLNLCVLRVYPSVFLNKNGSCQGTHSEKVEIRLQKHEEKIDFEHFEEIFSQVQKEMEHEAKMKRRKIGALQKYIRDVDDPAELLELIEEGFDLEDVQLDLTPEQQAFLAEYHQKISSRKIELVHERVKERLQNQINKRISTEIIKLRVIDSKNPAKTAILSIWRPQDSIRKVFQEGTCFEVSNCTPSGVRYGDMHLNTSKSSEYKFSSLKISTPSITNLLRKIMTISEINSRDFVPKFNEVDTCGLVVMITSPNVKKFQSVFICDFEENILCINFWNGLKEYAYDDVIQIERLIIASNLQWRTNSGTGVIPCVFATEVSTFTENPKTKYSVEALNALKDKFQSTNLIEFSLKCSEKIKNLQATGRTIGNSFATPIRKCLSINTPSPLNGSVGRVQHSVSISEESPNNMPSPQIRIDRLRMYGQPPAISPLSFNKCKRSARKSFRIPRKLTEDIENESR